MFSFILPVYNAEKTIEKTVTSILKNKTSQSIEIIIINDGSTDGTKQRLEQYHNDSRIKMIHQDNKGVSEARNQGLKTLDTSSTYTAFIDDSDTISENYIETHINLFKKYPEVQLSIAPIMLVKNNKNYPQSLNDRFVLEEEIINIENQPTAVQYHIGGTVFRSALFMEQGYRFNESVTFWEDAFLINSIILEVKQYGLAKGAYYFYDRNNQSSLSQSAWSKQSRYCEHIQNHYMTLIELSKQKYETVLPYIQHLVARHYKEYLAEYNQEAIYQYKHLISPDFYTLSAELFKEIEFETIDQLDCPLSIKIYLYQLKAKEMDLTEVRKQIKVLIQSYDFKSSTLHFTFSNEATGISGKSKISFNKQIAQITSNKQKYLLGEVSEADLTANQYAIKMNILRILFGFNLTISNNAEHYLGKRSSLFNGFWMKINKRKLSK